MLLGLVAEFERCWSSLTTAAGWRISGSRIFASKGSPGRDFYRG
jgi:hypothetical protein